VAHHVHDFPDRLLKVVAHHRRRLDRGRGRRRGRLGRRFRLRGVRLGLGRSGLRLIDFRGLRFGLESNVMNQLRPLFTEKNFVISYIRMYMYNY
jgi:hypothetical protein